MERRILDVPSMESRTAPALDAAVMLEAQGKLSAMRAMPRVAKAWGQYVAAMRVLGSAASDGDAFALLNRGGYLEKGTDRSTFGYYLRKARQILEAAGQS